MESMQQSNIKMCENCSKRFPQQKIDLHQAYCRRNIKRCNLCLQMYDINDQESHDKQFHSKKQCRYCHSFFPEKQYDNHTPACGRRPITCQYCQNDIAYEQFLKHQQACQARTTKCEICKKYFTLRQIDIHKTSCIQVPLMPAIRNQYPPRDQLRQNITEHPFGLQRIRSTEQRRFQANRGYLPSYEEPARRNEALSNQRVNVVSNEKTRKNKIQKPSVNFQNKVKPSHLIQPEKVRGMIDPVPISIRLAMQRNKKIPLQNRN